MSEFVLETRQLAIGYATSRNAPVVVADSISASLRPGEMVCLIGPNGAGKSTLLRTLAGMQPPLSGAVMLLGEDIHRLAARELAQRLSVVLTERVNPGLLTGYELVALGRHPHTDWAGRLSEQDKAIIQWAVEVVGAQPLATRPVNELSDGERQKIMIARALAQEPELMILDEPTAFLDITRRVEIMMLLRDLAHTTQRTILLATHDLDLALRSADRIWLLAAGGRFAVGAPEDLVLSGAFEAAFNSHGVAFDVMTGSFKLNAPSQRAVSLTGDGVAGLWTRRALERAGFAISSNGSQPPLHVEVNEGRWRLSRNGSAQEFSSLYALIAALQAAPSPEADDIT